MEPLRCDLFDPARTPLLNRVRLRNHVLQKVIELLSLSREDRGRRRGRISYSQLGINQLGAVYEGLLSYTGFFVEEKDGLYEVKPEGEPYDPLKQAYFVPKSALSEYKEEEKVYAQRPAGPSPAGQLCLPPRRAESPEIGFLLHARRSHPVRREVRAQGASQRQDRRRHPELSTSASPRSAAEPS